MNGFTDSNGRFIPTRNSNVALAFSDFEIAAGTPLAAFANGASTTPGVAFDNSKAAGVRWNNDAAPAAMYAAVLMPRHRQPGTDIIVHVLASKSGATVGDATTFTINAWAQTNGALQDAATDAGGATGALTGNAAAKTVQHVTRTLLGVNMPSAVSGVPTVLTIGIKPTAGTLGTDDITVHSVWLEYTETLAPLLP
jgi:hypothetical protein